VSTNDDHDVSASHDEDMPEREVMEQWAADRFELVPGSLNTATLGLPTRASLEVLQRRIAEWQTGTLYAPSFDADVDRCRTAYATLANTDPSRVAIASQASVVAGLVAGSTPAGSIVLCAEGDFTSVLFPFLADPDITVRLVPLDTLIDSITDDVDLVAVSSAQSSNGTLLDLTALADAADLAGARTFLDATQSAAWAEFDADRFDVTVCHGYKWLCSPRGAAFMTVSTAGNEWLHPRSAGWYAGDHPWTSIYGSPLRLAPDARRFDVSPPWFSFAAAAPTLEMLAELGTATIGRHSVSLANDFRERVGLEPSNSAIVSVSSDATDALRAAGIAHAPRDGRLRFSFYVYNTIADVKAAATIVNAER
jgi:selenocysteine lyase/cysteine desulfurase